MLPAFGWEPFSLGVYTGPLPSGFICKETVGSHPSCSTLPGIYELLNSSEKEWGERCSNLFLSLISEVLVSGDGCIWSTGLKSRLC